MEKKIRIKGVTRNPKGYWQLNYKPAGRNRTSAFLGKDSELTEDEAHLKAHAFLEGLRAKVATVSFIISEYRKTELPHNPISRQNWECLLNRIDEDWGPVAFGELIAGKIESWLKNLKNLKTGKDLAQSSKGEIRNQFGRLWTYVIKNQLVPGLTQTSTNPMNYVTIPESRKVVRKTKSLSEDDFIGMIIRLKRPFLTIFIMGIVHGLRISELLGLKWKDVNWRKLTFMVERRYSRGSEADTKTEGSKKLFPLKPRTLAELKIWREQTKYPGDEDWIFASPGSSGRMPYSCRRVTTVFEQAAKAIGLKRGNTHIMRHTHRWWMRLKNIPEKVQQEAMRHTNLGTLQRYGNDEMPELAAAAQGEVADMLFEALDRVMRQGSVQ